MSTIKEYRDIRLDKLKKLKQIGIYPYPSTSFRDTKIGDIVLEFERFDSKDVTVAGRIISIRDHGKVVFIDILDDSGQIQLYVKPENLRQANREDSELEFSEINLLDVGDYVEAPGQITKTKTGQISIQVYNIRILAKSLRPLPDSWEGLKDKEVRLRRRYIDIKVNQEVYKRFIRRSKFWEAHRQFFKSHGFLEINIPVLEHIPGGADANPFITHMDAIDEDFYLRISQELYLKRLIGGGYEKVFEIGPRFRNEGLSDEHLPEHIAMEFYWAYSNCQKGMDIVKKLFDFVIEYVYGNKKLFDIRGFKVDFSREWEIVDYGQSMKEKYGIDVYKVTFGEIKNLLKKHNLEALNLPRAVDGLWKILRKEISGPAFVVNHPKYLSPLQKPSREIPDIVERFQPIIAGSELGNGWSEVNDPVDQYERFCAQQKLRDAGDKEAQWLDIDYVEMLEYGMPPTFGYGHSERVFWFLEDVSAKEGVPFPPLKFDIDETTKEIYGL